MSDTIGTVQKSEMVNEEEVMLTIRTDDGRTKTFTVDMGDAGKYGTGAKVSITESIKLFKVGGSKSTGSIFMGNDDKEIINPATSTPFTTNMMKGPNGPANKKALLHEAQKHHKGLKNPLASWTKAAK